MKLFSVTGRIVVNHVGVSALIRLLPVTGRLRTVALGCLINKSSLFDLSFTKVSKKDLLENLYKVYTKEAKNTPN